MDETHGCASTLLRLIAWHPISMVIDTIDTERPIASILVEARARVDAVAAGDERPSS